MASCKSEIKKVRKELENGQSLEDLKDDFEEVFFSEGTFVEGDTSLPKKFKGKKGVSKVYQNNGMFIVVKVNQISASKERSFEDAKGQVISEYQEELEDEWMDSLREKHKVEVNKPVLAKLKKEFE